MESAHMNASEALNAVRAAGVNIRVDGDDLVLEAAASPPSAVLDALSYHKVSILALLRSVTTGLSAEDWRALFEERTNAFQREGGLQRDIAETKALAACIASWLNKNPVTSPAGRCIARGRGDRPNDVVLPIAPSRKWSASHTLRSIATLAQMCHATSRNQSKLKTAVASSASSARSNSPSQCQYS